MRREFIGKITSIIHIIGINSKILLQKSDLEQFFE
jgi:hypothetical protein